MPLTRKYGRRGEKEMKRKKRREKNSPLWRGCVDLKVSGCSDIDVLLNCSEGTDSGVWERRVNFSRKGSHRGYNVPENVENTGYRKGPYAFEATGKKEGTQKKDRSVQTLE